MPVILWTALLLLGGVAEAQSGDKEQDYDVFCTSNISVVTINSITCNTIGNNDNEDDEDECGRIQNMTICFNDKWDAVDICHDVQGNSITATYLDVINTVYYLTAQSNKGCKVKATINLRKIVKPNPPQLKSVIFNDQSKRAVIHILNPYEEDYLRSPNQLFQVSVFNENHSLVHNTTEDFLPIEGEYLHGNTEYTVKVRAIPNEFFKGTWSDWSSPGHFSTHTDFQDQEQQIPDEYFWILCTIAILLMVWIGFQWRKRIQAYICPSIPHPKHTLLQICKPTKGPAVSFNSEAFRDPNIHLVHSVVEQQSSEEKPPDAAHPPDTESPSSTLVCSADNSESTAAGCSTTTISSSNSSGSRDDSVSTLLSGSYTGADDPGSRGASPTGVLLLMEGRDSSRSEEGSDPDVNGAAPQGKDEAYVTMCSFYQIK